MTLAAAKAQAVAMMARHGLIGEGWRFGFDRSVSRFGACRHSKRMITLSRKMTELNAEAEVMNTVLHEIAHALVGRGHGHDQVWKAKAREVGARPERCYSVAQAVVVQGKYVGQCPICKAEFQRHKRPPMAAQYHPACYRVWRGQKEIPQEVRIVWRVNSGR